MHDLITFITDVSGSAVERINLSGSLKRRLNRYKNDDKLCNFLLSKKSGNSANLNDSLCEEHISDNSDDGSLL